MKRLLFFVIIFGLMISVMSAQTKSPATTSTTFSEQEKEDAKKELQKVGEVFGVKKADPPASTAPAKTEDKPATMADVADKALNMVGNAVGTIAGIVQKVAPEVWEIMVRQQYAMALGMLVSPFLFLLINLAYVVIVKKYWKKWDGFEEAEWFSDSNGPFTRRGMRAVFTTFFPSIIALIFTGVLAYRIGDAVPMLINPKVAKIDVILNINLNLINE